MATKFTTLTDGFVYDPEAIGKTWPQCEYGDGWPCEQPAHQANEDGDRYCSTHRYRLEHGLPMDGVYRPRDGVCDAAGCESKIHASRLCGKHLKRRQRGQTLVTHAEMVEAGLLDS